MSVIFSCHVIQLSNHLLQCDFWDNSATSVTALASPIAHGHTQTDQPWEQWSGCGLQHCTGTLTTSVICSLRKKSYKNTWRSTGFHFSGWSSEFPLPMQLHAILSAGCGPADRLGHRMRESRLRPPQLRQVNEVLVTQAKLRWGCNSWDHTNLTVALWLPVRETLNVFSSHIDGFLGHALMSKAVASPLRCSRPRWNQTLPPLSRLTFSKSIQEKVDVKSKALL